ncbi:FecR family protein [Rubritalea squalenifaciens DSM 18772]|uniref:FecR family protein n=2 Tax=Rubritalea squalenifaciens TaxID=407226 RepID=A0A1M6DWE1_9BACT|nr:FecR family protein [Rubritalea squalenifaciens DSM 18772]
MLKLFDGDISHAEFERLQQMMREDVSLRDLYLEHAAMEHVMDDLVGTQSVSSHRKILSMGSSMRRSAMRWAGIAAVALLTMGVWVGWNMISDISVRADMRFSYSSKWSVDGEAGVHSPELKVGQKLRLEYGAVELSLPKGVVGIVEGPATVELVEADLVRMVEGRGSFMVPEEGHGFAVETERMKVVDLGTAFTVVTGWGERDEVYVNQGSVEVHAADNSRLLEVGQALRVSALGELEDADYDNGQFLAKLPGSVQLVFADDFESHPYKDGEVGGGGFHAWSAVGKTSGGYFNPRGHGVYYRNKNLDDTGPSSGLLDGMKGANVGFLYSAKQVGIERKIGVLAEPGTYTLQLALGVRDNRSATYGGYTISLMSHGRVLQEIRSNEVPGPKNAFTKVVLSYDATNLPEGVSYGDPLEVRIMCNAAGAPKRCYLDFDNLQLSFMARSLEK